MFCLETYHVGTYWIHISEAIPKITHRVCFHTQMTKLSSPGSPYVSYARLTVCSRIKWSFNNPIWAVLCENVSLDIYRQWRPRSACAVWSGPSLSANRITEYYRMYKWRAKVRLILWAESLHFCYVGRLLLLDAALMLVCSQRDQICWFCKSHMWLFHIGTKLQHNRLKLKTFLLRLLWKVTELIINFCQYTCSYSH